jgi:hypothetical protein
MPTIPRTCAIAAITDPNRAQHESRTGPNISETKNSMSNTAAFHTIGPIDTTAIRMSGLGGVTVVPFAGNDLTNMYAITNKAARTMGEMTSAKRTARQPARGTSPESFSDGRPNFFFLYPVIIVRERRQ